MLEHYGPEAKAVYDRAKRDFRTWSANYRNFSPREPLRRVSGTAHAEDRVMAHVREVLTDPGKSFDHLLAFEMETKVAMDRYLLTREQAQERVLRAMEKREGFSETVRELNSFVSSEDWTAMLRKKEIFRDTFFGPGTSHGINNHRIQFHALAREIERNPANFTVNGKRLTASDIYALMGDARFETTFNTAPRTLWQETFDIFLERNFQSPGYWTRVREQFGLSKWQ